MGDFINKYKKVLLAIILLIVIAGVIFFLFNYLNGPVRNFKQSLENMDIQKLQEIYSSTVSYDDKKGIENVFQSRLDETVNKFAIGEKSYEDVKQELEGLNELSQLKTMIDKSLEKLNNLKDSKDNFAKAQELKNTDLLQAYACYLKVIELDSNNYNIAQNFISTNKENIKKNVLYDVDNLIKENNYIEANNKLTDLNNIITNDELITQKINEVKEKAKIQEIEKYKNEQEVIVESASLHTEWYSDSVSGVTVIIKNNSNKVIKNYVVGILAYDENKYPLNISYNEFLFRGKGSAVNVQPGQTHGSGQYFNIYYNEDKMRTVIACVESVEYYDGTKWENPYFNYWTEQYKGNPIE